MKLTEALEVLCIATRANGRSKRTVQSYRQKIGPMIDHLDDVHVQDVTVHKLRCYVAELMDSDLSPFTVASRVRHMKRLWNWLQEEGEIEENPAERIQTPRPKRDKPKGISTEDLQALLRETQGEDLIERRDRALILFLADTGARVGGVAGLRIGALDLQAGLATVKEKGNKTRQVPFTRPTAEALATWIQAAGIEEGAVFIGLSSKSDGGLTANGIQQMLRRRSKQAGCQGPTNPHSFRHAFARHYLLDGGDLGTLSDLLGHESVSITKEYYGIFRMSELQKLHWQHSPVRAILEDGDDE